MLISSILALAGSVSLASASPTLMKRTPSDKSGKSVVAFKCSGETIPYPGGAEGEGEGGSGYFTSSLAWFPDGESGTKITPSGCTYTDKSHFCSNCLLEGGGLSSATNVTACWNPPAGRSGCSIDFQYNGYHFNSQNKEPYCGHDNSFGPFSDTITALCYFNVTGTA